MTVPEPSRRFGPAPDHLLAFTVDSEPCVAHPGDTVAAALYASGRRAWGRSRTGEMRGLFCGIGVCYECLVTVDGVPNQRACQVEIRSGMVIRTDLEELPKP